jgi:YD repeat-containing protein
MGVTYPGDPNIGWAPSPTYSYDGMGRLNAMSGEGVTVNGVQYNAAGQMTQMVSLGSAEARSYNSMGQLTNVTNCCYINLLNITYTYSPNQNNGKIVSQTDNLTGEQVSYAYDSLNRLTSAIAGTSWGQGFQYDPFGNLIAKTVLAGSAPPWYGWGDPATNRMGNTDANGNALQYGFYLGLGYDSENRVTAAGSMNYAYDGQNKRIWGGELGQ